MQIYLNKENVLQKKRVEPPRDGFATPNGRQFIVVEQQYGSMTSPWRTDARNVSFLNHFGGQLTFMLKKLKRCYKGSYTVSVCIIISQTH